MGEEAGTGWVGFRTCRSLGREYGAAAPRGETNRVSQERRQGVSMERDRGTGMLEDPRPGISACGGARSQPGLEMGGGARAPRLRCSARLAQERGRSTTARLPTWPCWQQGSGQ